VIPLTLF